MTGVQTCALPISGFFKAIRGDTGPELIRANSNAFVLLYIIAHRARWRQGFNAKGLGPGEALIGDHAECSMSAREYRTAKHFLSKHGFATFKPTNKGTIATLAKLAEGNVFDINSEKGDEPSDNQNNERPTSTRQLTKKGRRK